MLYIGLNAKEHCVCPANRNVRAIILNEDYFFYSISSQAFSTRRPLISINLWQRPHSWLLICLRGLREHDGEKTKTIFFF